MIKDIRHEKYFLFTQQSISTFEKCPLKFKKRYIENLKWDYIPDIEIKKNFERGIKFHLLACRKFMGFEKDIEEYNEEFPEVFEWLKELDKSFEIQPENIYLPEHKLRIVKDNIKLEANFDLIIIKEDSIEIWDWKTRGNSKNNASKKPMFKDSLQTKVYLYVLKELAKSLFNKDISTDKITMYYWLADTSSVAETIEYSEKLHKDYEDSLKSKIDKILNYNYKDFDKSEYTKQCSVCEFNWFCNTERIDLDKFSKEFSADLLNWDDIEEVF